MRPGRSDETAAERFARYTEGFSVEDEDAPPLPLVRSLCSCGMCPSFAQCMRCHRQQVFAAPESSSCPWQQEEDEEELAAAEAAAAADAADLIPMAPGDGSAADQDLEQLVSCLAMHNQEWYGILAQQPQRFVPQQARLHAGRCCASQS